MSSNVRRKKMPIAQQFAQEEAQSALFMQKLTKMKKDNKQSKQRTVINQHKIEWQKQMKTYLKREKNLEDELNKFMTDFQTMQVQSKCEDSTKKVREHIKNHKKDQKKIQTQFNEFESTFQSVKNDEPLAIEFNNEQSTMLGSSENRPNQIIEESEDDENQYDMFGSYMTVDPMNDEIFGLRELLNESIQEKNKGEEFELNLYASVRGIKQLVSSLKSQTQLQTNNKKLGKKSNKQDDDSVYTTKMKCNELMNDFQESLDAMSGQFKIEVAECQHHIQYHKQNISNYIGYDDTRVRGFDLELEFNEDEYDDSLDQLDVYAEFLGKNEYFKMKENFQKALYMMTEIYKVEKERLNMNQPTTYQELIEKYDVDTLNRFQNIHELYLKNGKSRQKYFQRLQIEFQFQNYKRADIDLIDSFFEHKRWVKLKLKNMQRDLQRDRQNLKEKSVTMIESEVENERIKIQQEYQAQMLNSKQRDIQDRLQGQRQEYEQKMKIFNEINREKERQRKQAEMMKQHMMKQRAGENKAVAQNFKDHKDIQKLRLAQQQMQQEQIQKQELYENVQKNKEQVSKRQTEEMIKLQERNELLEEKRIEGQVRQEKLDKAVEGYAFRPQVEADEARLYRITDAQEIRKNTELDKADKITLNANKGFTADKLMSDVRFKISSALHDAGLQNSTYGKEVLKGVNTTYVNRVQRNDQTKGLF